MKRALLTLACLVAATPAVGDGRVASKVFGAVATPDPRAPQAVGFYSKGCLAGAVALPADGPTWQTMRPSRNRAWGHPVTIDFLIGLAAAAPEAGLRGILVGDISQPRGGPMPYGHASHQMGLDADIWLMEMPAEPLSLEARETLPFQTVIGDDGTADPARLTPALRLLIEVAARDERVGRIFVNPVIKRALCETAGSDRGWLRRVRPWYGHDKHFHVRLKCPAGSPACRRQAPPPSGDGCGAPLDYWFSPEPYRPKPKGPAKGPLKVADLPALCRRMARAVVAAPPRPARHPRRGEVVPLQAPTPMGQETPVPPSPQ